MRNLDNSTKRTMALVMSFGAMVPATASARPAGPDPVSTKPVPPTVQIVETTEAGGFDLGDAGIGAAGGIGLALIAFAGAGAVHRRRVVPRSHAF